MQKAERGVTLTIGKGVYTLTTRLGADELGRVRLLIEEACGEVQKGFPQEDVLVIACLRLAYGLDEVREKLCRIAEELR